MDLSYNQKYYLANKEKLIAYQLIYRQNNPHKFTSYQRRYKSELYKKPEARKYIVEYQREYRRLNPQKYHQKRKNLDNKKKSKENEPYEKLTIFRNINKLIEFNI